MHNQVSETAPAPVLKLQRSSRDRRPGAKLAVTIAVAADQLDVSYQTLWRAIRDGEFPGIKIRGRIVVPIKAVEQLLDAVCASGQLVDAADWTAAWRVETPAAAEAS
ncbi:helix-turn-helix domain-containing protein [Streptomyces sp. NPDC058572]|uniref:helix-turn-helix domain-containing protein n=1 Tax=Streptomyces sp. NPDC058572 TaxID=3346546 RepID=UPI0036534F7B